MDGIDRNRGCQMRFHPTGYRVVEYGDAPGVYHNELGEVISERIAEEAGFDIKTGAIRRKKQAKLKEYRKRVEDEFASAEEQVEKELNEAAAKGKSVRHVGGGKYGVYQGDKRLTSKPLSREEAEAIVNDAPEPEFDIPEEFD